jgi:hypothetical protein
LAYVFVSQTGGGMLCLSVKHSQHTWVIKERFDQYRKITDRFYSVPKEMLKPFSLMSGMLVGLQKSQEGK